MPPHALKHSPARREDWRKHPLTRSHSPRARAGHSAELFRFKDHAPFAFRHLREHFGVDTQEYMVSICGEHSLRELGTPGKSGAVFYLTEDGRFVIKTVSKKESKFLRQILPTYYKYVMECEDTMIPRFFGLIRIKTRTGRNIRMVVMNNLLPLTRKVHEKYDLKGSTLGRWATDEEKRSPHVTLKDRDLNTKHEGGLALPERSLKKMQEQIQNDCQWLRQHHIMDYSLLLLLHFPSRRDSDYDELDAGSDSDRGDSGGTRTNYAASRSCGSLANVDEQPKPVTAETHSSGVLLEPADSHRVDSASPPPQAGEGGAAAPSAIVEVVQTNRPRKKPGFLKGRSGGATGTSGAAGASGDVGDDSDSDDDGKSNPALPRLNDSDLAQAFARSRASSVRVKERLFNDPTGALRATTSSGTEVLIFGGIIDVLQQYGARKQLEHGYKSIRYASEKEGISVTDPQHYAARFASFITGKFVLDKDGAAPAPAAADAPSAAAPAPTAADAAADADAAPAPAAPPRQPGQVGGPKRTPTVKIMAPAAAPAVAPAVAPAAA